MAIGKKGGERILSIYLFIIYIIVTIGIVSGVLLVYGKGLDVREAEAGILGSKVVDCLVEQGVLKEEVFSDFFDLSDFCRFDFSGEEYGVRIEILDFDSKRLLKKKEFGREDFFEFCDEKGERLSKCSEKKLYVLRKPIFESSSEDYLQDPSDIYINQQFQGTEKIILKVLGAVGKADKNV